MRKRRIYVKFISGFVLWCLIFFFTKTPIFNSLINNSLSKLKSIDIIFFLFVWMLLSIKYVVKMIKLGEDIYTKPEKIYDFMDCLLVLMLVQNVIYINIVLLSRMINITNEVSIIIFIVNIFLVVIYYYKNKINEFKKTHSIQIFIFLIFILFSNSIELLMMDFAFLFYFLLYKSKINLKRINNIDYLSMFLCFISFYHFVYLFKNGVVIINYICYFIYFTYLIYKRLLLKKY